MHKLRNDLILIGSLLIVISISFILFFTLSKKENLNVLIYENNELVYQGELSDEKKLEFNHVIVVIEAQGVYVQYSNCKDQVCVHQGKINRAGQTIVCLPNKISIRLEGRQVDVGI